MKRAHCHLRGERGICSRILERALREMDLFIIFRFSAQNHSFSSLRKHLPHTGTHNVSSMMPKLALKMFSAACTANPARAGDPRCIVEYGKCANLDNQTSTLSECGPSRASLQCVEWYFFFLPCEANWARLCCQMSLPVHTSTSSAALENAPLDVLPETSCLSAHKALDKLKMFLVFFPLSFLSFLPLHPPLPPSAPVHSSHQHQKPTDPLGKQLCYLRKTWVMAKQVKLAMGFRGSPPFSLLSINHAA